MVAEGSGEPHVNTYNVDLSVRIVPESRLAGLIDETWQDKLMSAPLGDWVVTENWRWIDNVRLRRGFVKVLPADQHPENSRFTRSEIYEKWQHIGNMSR